MHEQRYKRSHMPIHTELLGEIEACEDNFFRLLLIYHRYLFHFLLSPLI